MNAGYECGSAYISPVCKKLVEKGYVERRDPGEYRITHSGIKVLMSQLEASKYN